MSQDPLVVGNNVFVKTVTEFLIGTVTELVEGSHFVLSNVSWIASTGRWNNALSTGILDEVEPYTHPVRVSLGAYVIITSWVHPIPDKVK